MQRSVVFSCILHLAFFAALLFSRTAPRKLEGYPTVIPVEIVEMKPVSFKAPEVEKVAPKLNPPKPKPKELEGVTVEKPKIVEEKEPEPEPIVQKETPKESDKGKSAAEGKKLKLDVKEFPFSYYLSVIESRISANWEPPFGAVGSAVVHFNILRNGQLTSIQIQKESGNFLLDQAALRAVTLANPLPRLPYDYSEPSLGVSFEFEQGRN